MTSKQRAYLKGLAMKEDTILHIGKGGVTPELTENVRLALVARELEFFRAAWMIRRRWHRCWRREPSPRSCRSSEKRSFCIRKVRAMTGRLCSRSKSSSMLLSVRQQASAADGFMLQAVGSISQWASHGKQ